MKADKTLQLINLRPVIDLTLNGTKNELEDFMHQTLRPILKFLHHTVYNYLKAEKHLDFTLLNGKDIKAKQVYLTQFVQKNNILKNTLIGMTVGLFTEEELEFYLQHKKTLNKRISDMLIVRMLSNFN